MKSLLHALDVPPEVSAVPLNHKSVWSGPTLGTLKHSAVNVPLFIIMLHMLLKFYLLCKFKKHLTMEVLLKDPLLQYSLVASPKSSFSAYIRSDNGKPIAEQWPNCIIMTARFNSLQRRLFFSFWFCLCEILGKHFALQAAFKHAPVFCIRVCVRVRAS